MMTNKKYLLCLSLVLSLVLGLFLGPVGVQAETDYPEGTVLIYCTGQPQFLQMYYEKWLEDHQDIAPGVEIEIAQVESMADARQKVAMDYLAGAYDDMPDALYIDPVGIIDLATEGLLLDVSEFYQGIEDEFVDGAADEGTLDGKVYGLPESVRPQVVFYNQAIFDEYDIDPERMATFEGYYEVGKELKEKSDGEVYLSYISPSSHSWRYWGRRGLMPQANAEIWDEDGSVIIGENDGARLALDYLGKLVDEDLLYRSTMMEPPLYEATDEGKIATYYMGAFWDEFLRANLTETAGDWRVMNAPVFEDVEEGGAPVTNYLSLVNKGDNPYAELVQKMWYDFQTDMESRNAWVTKMEEIKGAYSNPIAKELLADPFWQEPSDFYGGQSFRKAEGDGLSKITKNMRVTPKDGEADMVISAEIERFIAGEQTMDDAIENMQRELDERIGTADMQ